MKSDKEAALALVADLPDDASTETIAELVFKLRVIHGIEQANRGEVVDHERVVERMARLLEPPQR